MCVSTSWAEGGQQSPGQESQVTFYQTPCSTTQSHKDSNISPLWNVFTVGQDTFDHRKVWMLWLILVTRTQELYWNSGDICKWLLMNNDPHCTDSDQQKRWKKSQLLLLRLVNSMQGIIPVSPPATVKGMKAPPTPPSPPLSLESPGIARVVSRMRGSWHLQTVSRHGLSEIWG